MCNYLNQEKTKVYLNQENTRNFVFQGVKGPCIISTAELSKGVKVIYQKCVTSHLVYILVYK